MRFPVEWALASLDCRDVQRAPGPSGESGAVEEDAGVVDEPGHCGGIAFVVRVALTEKPLSFRLRMELPMPWFEPRSVAFEIL